MQIQIPHIPSLENVSDLLNILGNKTKFGERLTLLNEAQETLNKSLDRFKDISDIEEAKNQAASLVAGARRVKEDADKYAKEKRDEADKEAESILAKAQAKNVESLDREKAVSAREANVAFREAAVDAREKELEKREKQAEADLERAAALARQAQALQDKLNVKLGQLQSIAVD